MGITGAAKLLVYVGLVEVNPENNWYYSLFDALTASKDKEVGFTISCDFSSYQLTASINVLCWASFVDFNCSGNLISFY